MGSIREWRFKRRVGLEREVLSAVNHVFSKTEPLIGLTEAAIDNWQSLLLPVHGDRCLTVVHALREVSRRLSLDADSSREVFRDEELVETVTVGNAITRLMQELRKSGSEP